MVTPQRRASRPSTQSVAAATANNTAATISPVAPCSFSTSHITTGVSKIRVAEPRYPAR